MTGVNPPGYRKRGGKRVLWVVLRNDQYKFEDDYVILKGLRALGSTSVRYSGRIHVFGKQGRAEICYDLDEKKWYMHISFEVEEKIVRDKMIKVPVNPPGNKSAGIDIGINNLLAIYVEDGSALLVSGRPLKAISFYWRNRISEYQSMLNRYGFKTSRMLRKMYKKWRKQIRSYINWAVGNTVKWLYLRGVSEVVVGYPRYIVQEPGEEPYG